MTSAVAARAPRVGEPAPDFTLASTSGEPVSLSALRGKEPVLIAFFPLAFTSVCTAELCDIGSEWDQFVGKGVRVLPISVDSVPTLREFRSKHSLPFDLLSDFRREVSRAYGVLLEDRFHSGRAYFLVDREGIVRWAHVEEKTAHKRENRELLARMDALA
jgi:peroxiredoxin